MDDISLKGGVLIIGSLLWEQDKIRKNWRNNFLEEENKIKTKAPIRYGRISGGRNCTFTMVFSEECNSEDMLGTAFFVPFRDNPVSLEALRKQSLELIKSECKKDKSVFEIFNWSWGTLALAINPDLLDKDPKKHKQLSEFWKKQCGEGLNPKQYKVGNEKPAVDEQGILSFNWTDELKDFDFLIATATKPEKEYPISKKIADRIIVNEYSEYFIENVKAGISTFQDKEIQSFIE
ncbi:MAG: hypothetical protein RBR78_09875 [Flavobacteriaceae bacterium]|jgi:hypothetical protein|nr:hypothetical protein [Flavobacteriaceae bacterium]